MATIIDKATIKEMLENGGSYRGDPVPHLVYLYKDNSGEVAYAVFYDYRHDDIYQSPFVDQSSIICLFTSGILTKGGQEFLNGK